MTLLQRLKSEKAPVKVELKPKYLRLLNGMSLLCYGYEMPEKQSWYLDRPLQCMSDVGKTGEHELVLFPFIPTTITPQKHVILENSRILYAVDIVGEIEEYVKKFAAEYYDKDVRLSVQDLTPKKQQIHNRDVMSLLDSLTEHNDDGNSGPNNGGGNAA